MGHVRPSLSVVIVAVAAAVALLAPASMASPSTAASADGSTSLTAVLDAMNDARVDRGLSPLQLHRDLELVELANDDYARTGLAHRVVSEMDGPWYDDPDVSTVGEIQYTGRPGGPQQAVAAWSDSPSHATTMYDADATHVAIGADTGGDRTVYTAHLLHLDPITDPTSRSAAAACPDDQVPAGGFRDVSGGPHAAAIACLVSWEVTSGTDGGTFEPAGQVTRGQLATFLASGLAAGGVPLPQGDRTAFTDVDAGDVHAPAIASLSAAGVIDGYPDGTFRPHAAVQRGQMASLLTGAFEHASDAGLAAPQRHWFGDVPPDHGFATDINRLADAGWSTGYPDATYRSWQTVRRDQMASFVTRWLDHLVEEGVVERPA